MALKALYIFFPNTEHTTHLTLCSDNYEDLMLLSFCMICYD